MTITAYAMSDHADGHLRLPEHKGGCGGQHAVETGENGYPCIRCDQCAPVLIASHYGWSAKPEGVPATPDERAYRDHVKRESDTSNAEVDNAMRREWIRGQQGTRDPSITEQVASMSAEDRAALRELLGGDTPAHKPTQRTSRSRTAAAK